MSNFTTDTTRTATLDAATFGTTLPRDAEETLVTDGRGAMSPSQHVEQKLIGMLKASPLLVSQVQRRLRPGPR